MTTEPAVREFIYVEVSAQVAYAAISDPSRIASWSPEFNKAYLPNPGSLRVGQKFSGGNRNGIRRWRTSSVVVRANRPKEFAFDVRAAGMPVARWSYLIEATDSGTRVTESWTDLRTGALGQLMWAVGTLTTGVSDRQTHNRASIQATLAAMKADLEGN